MALNLRFTKKRSEAVLTSVCDVCPPRLGLFVCLCLHPSVCLIRPLQTFAAPPASALLSINHLPTSSLLSGSAKRDIGSGQNKDAVNCREQMNHL